MAQTHIILDQRRKLVSSRCIDNQSEATAFAVSVDASHVIACDTTLACTIAEKLHSASTVEALWEAVTVDLFGLVDVHEVGARVAAAPHYPVNLAVKAKPVWDEIVQSSRFKNAIAGRPPEAQYAVAVKWLYEACRRKGIHPFTTGDSAGDPDATGKDKLVRQLNLCKSYVEQVYRNFINMHLALSQENWKAPKVVQAGNLFRIETSKKIKLKRGSSTQVESLLRRYEGFSNDSYIHKVTPASRVGFGFNHPQHTLVAVMALVMTKAQMIESMSLTHTSGSALLAEANRRLGPLLMENIRSVVATASTDDSKRIAAEEVARFIIRGIVSKRMKMNRQRSGSLVVPFKHKLVGHRTAFVEFFDADTGTDEAQAVLDRPSKQSVPKVEVSCSFAFYKIPEAMLPDLEKTPLFSALVSALESLIAVKRSYKSDAEKENNKQAANSVADPKDFRSAVSELIMDWTRHGNHDDILHPFPIFYNNFCMYFKQKDNDQLIASLSERQRQQFVLRLKTLWEKNQPVTGTTTAKELKVVRVSLFDEVGGEEKLQLPADTMLRPIKKKDEEDSDTWQVVHPTNLFGRKVILDSEDYMNCTSIDNDIDSFMGSIEAAHRIAVNDYAKLPSFHSEDGRVGKFLGPAEIWKFVSSPMWMHHLNLKMNHKSLSFEKITKDGTDYLAVVFHGDW